MSEIGVLVMAYGGPRSLEDVEPYLRDVRGGRATPPAVVEEVRERYRRIGGASPITERTMAQAGALEVALGGNGFRTAVGMRHWHPYIKDTLGALQARGFSRIVGLVMAPHFSPRSVGAYFDAVRAPGIELARIDSWHLLPGYLDALADHVRDALERFPADVRGAVPVIFTAHSLPEQWREPYVPQLCATIAALTSRFGNQPFEFAFQSAGMSHEPWLGPDVGVVLERLARDGAPGVVVAPIGFVSDHVEILYDIDVELAERAERLGICLERTRMLNDAPALIGGLADLVRRRARAMGWT